MRLNEAHMLLHALQLLIYVVLNLTLTTIYITGMAIGTALEWITYFYFCGQPLYLVLMLYVIYRMTKGAKSISGSGV